MVCVINPPESGFKYRPPEPDPVNPMQADSGNIHPLPKNRYLASIALHSIGYNPPLMPERDPMLKGYGYPLPDPVPRIQDKPEYWIDANQFEPPQPPHWYFVDLETPEQVLEQALVVKKGDRLAKRSCGSGNYLLYFYDVKDNHCKVWLVEGTSTPSRFQSAPDSPARWSMAESSNNCPCYTNQITHTYRLIFSGTYQEGVAISKKAQDELKSLQNKRNIETNRYLEMVRQCFEADVESKETHLALTLASNDEERSGIIRQAIYRAANKACTQYNPEHGDHGNG